MTERLSARLSCKFHRLCKRPDPDVDDIDKTFSQLKNLVNDIYKKKPYIKNIFNKNYKNFIKLSTKGADSDKLLRFIEKI